MEQAKILFALISLLGCSFHTNVEDKTAGIHDKSGHEVAQNHLTERKNASLKEKMTNQAARNNIKFVGQKVILDVPLIRQNPELKYGCEVTSLAMVLQYAGVKVDKMTLAEEIKKDSDPIVKTKSGNIVSWGNPSDGFVGDMTGKEKGYAVYDQPLTDLMEKYMPERAVNLTGSPFDELLRYVQNKHPVVVWTTGDYRLPDRWESWNHESETIKTPLDLHAVVLVGFDDKNVYINDPLWGKKAHRVNKEQFISSWVALNKRAVSYN